MLLCVCTRVSLSPFTNLVILHCIKYKLISCSINDYLSFLVFLGWTLTLLDRHNDHLVRRSISDRVCSINWSLVIDGQASSECKRPLVDLIVLLPYDALHIGQAVLYIAIEGRLLTPPFNVSISHLNFRHIGRKRILFYFLVQTLLTLPHRVVAGRLVSALSPAYRGSTSLETGSSTKNMILLDSFEEFWVSLVRWIVWAVCDADSRIGEILHRLWGIRLTPFPTMAHCVLVRSLIWLIGVHHLIVCHLLKTISWSVVHRVRLRIFLRWKWAPCHLGHRVVIGHLNLSIILVVFAIKSLWN